MRADRREPELLRYVVEKGSIAVDGVSLTVADVDDDGFSVSLIPETLERTTLGPAAPGRRGEPGGGRAGEVRREAGRVAHERRPRRSAPIEEAHRGHPRRQDGRGLRRRGPRERGRPHARGAVRHARGDQLHGQGGARADLPGADPRALRRARPRPDGGQERVAASRPRSRSRSRRARASPPASPPHDRAHTIQVAIDPALEPERPRPAGPHLPAEGQGRRRARAHRPDRGRASTWRGWPASTRPA